MPHRKCLFLAMLGLAWCFTAPLAAKDICGPVPWDPTLPNQTTQAWEVNSENWEMQENIPANSLLNNPFGLPMLDLIGNWDIDWDNDNDGLVVGPDGTLIPTWHVGEGGGQVTITLPNNPLGGDVKAIYWQMTSDKSPTPTGNPPTTNPPGTSLPAPYSHLQHPFGTWYTYNGLIEIRPNPASETLTFDLAYCTHIEEIVVKTVCYTVPEPGSLSLFLAGALGLCVFVWRKRR